MPTPKRTHIPVTLQESPSLSPELDRSSVLMPLGINPGMFQTIDDEIWARIDPKVNVPRDGSAYQVHETIQLEATFIP